MRVKRSFASVNHAFVLSLASCLLPLIAPIDAPVALSGLLGSHGAVRAICPAPVPALPLWWALDCAFILLFSFSSKTAPAYNSIPFSCRQSLRSSPIDPPRGRIPCGSAASRLCAASCAVLPRERSIDPSALLIASASRVAASVSNQQPGPRRRLCHRLAAFLLCCVSL